MNVLSWLVSTVLTVSGGAMILSHLSLSLASLVP